MHPCDFFMDFQGSSMGQPSLPLKYTGKTNFFPGTLIILPSWGMTLEDFKFSRNSWPKFCHLPLRCGRKSHVNNLTALPHKEGSVSFGYCTAVACRTKTKTTIDALSSVFKAVTNWGRILRRTYPQWMAFQCSNNFPYQSQNALWGLNDQNRCLITLGQLLLLFWSLKKPCVSPSQRRIFLSGLKPK